MEMTLDAWAAIANPWVIMKDVSFAILPGKHAPSPFLTHEDSLTPRTTR